MSTTITKKPQTLLTGQYTVTATATAIGSTRLVNGIIVKAKTTNTGNVMLGGSTVNTTQTGAGNGYILEAGSEVFVPTTSLANIYAIGTANDVISYIGV